MKASLARYRIPLNCSLLALSITLGAVAALQAADVPAGTAVLELQLPPGAKVSADGHDYGTSRQLTYKKITPGKLRSTTLTVTFADGTNQQRLVHMDSGQTVRLAMQPARGDKPELVVQAGDSGTATDAPKRFSTEFKSAIVTVQK